MKTTFCLSFCYFSVFFALFPPEMGWVPKDAEWGSWSELVLSLFFIQHLWYSVMPTHLNLLEHKDTFYCPLLQAFKVLKGSVSRGLTGVASGINQ
jgi:hypothetical protein